MNEMTLLIVDDDELVLQSLTETIELTFDVKILRASSAVSALETIKKHKVDIIISDIKMPEMSGLEMVALLKAQGFEGPIIICSAHSEKENLLKSVSLQVFEFLEKPVRHEQLFNTIQRAIDSVKKNQKYQLSCLDLNTQQQAILEMLISGLTNQQIAKNVNLSEPTIKYHVGKLLKKYETADRIELKTKIQNSIAHRQWPTIFKKDHVAK
jgi:DNA-binding NarL/FixJ family response regulator